MPTISVVIPCLNEEKYLAKLLKNLERQTTKADEVIVADCKSEDDTIGVANKLKNLSLKIVESDIRSPGAARNAGAAAATSEYLLFIDADITIPKDFIEVIKYSLSSSPVDLLTPKYRSDGGNLADTILFWMVNSALYTRNKILKTGFAVGGVMCVRRSSHESIGGFDPGRQAHNDLDYLRKLKRTKPKFTYLDKLVVVHSSRRYQNQNLAQSLLALVRENTAFGFAIQPILQKKGRGKKYGRHD